MLSHPSEYLCSSHCNWLYPVVTGSVIACSKTVVILFLIDVLYDRNYHYVRTLWQYWDDAKHQLMFLTMFSRADSLNIFIFNRTKNTSRIRRFSLTSLKYIFIRKKSAFLSVLRAWAIYPLIWIWHTSTYPRIRV